MLRRLSAITCSLLLASIDSAQTTHVVDLDGLSFVPQSLTVDVGDSVCFNWIFGLHNVESGVNGVFDGAFTSGFPVNEPNQFLFTFDQAFLDAHPRPGNRYDYYCIVHIGFSMIGDITVRVPASAVSRNDAGGSNPIAYGNTLLPALGQVWSSTIDTSAYPTASLTAIAGFAAPFEITLGIGVLLVDPSSAHSFTSVASASGGASNHSASVPNDLALMGLEVFTQGVIFAGPAGGGVQLTNAIDYVLGT